MTDHRQRRGLMVDAGGVLVMPDPGAIREALTEFGPQPTDEACWQTFCEMIRLLDETPMPDYAEVNRAFAAGLGVAPDAQERAALMLVSIILGTRWVPIPGAAGALRQLAGAGYRIAIVSNTMHGEIEAVLRATELCSVDSEVAPVVAVIDSHVVGWRKPDRRIFEVALETLGMEPRDCIHVGDSLRDDVLGASEVGIVPVHVDPFDLCGDGDHRHARSFEAFSATLLRS